MPFKAIKRKVKGWSHGPHGKRLVRNGNTTVVKVFKDGANGTGVTLPFACGFCSTAESPVRFRSRRQRNQHTQFCPK